MSIPPMVYDAGGSGRDYMTREGATVLAATITRAWKRAGHAVEAVVVPVNLGTAEMPNTIFTVRMPTLHNGLPVR